MSRPGKRIRVESYHFVHSIMVQGQASSALPGKEQGVTEIWVAGRCYPLCAVGVGVGVGSDVHDTDPDRDCTVCISGPSLDGTVSPLLSTCQLGVQTLTPIP